MTACPMQAAYLCCSLLCRTFDSSLTEVCYEEGIELLAYSPLAMGLLTVSRCGASLRCSSCVGSCCTFTLAAWRTVTTSWPASANPTT